MALLNDYAHIAYPAEVVPDNRFQESAVGGGGLPVAGQAVPAAGQTYGLRIRCWQDNATDAAAMNTLLDTLLGGATFTVTNHDPADGHTYTCRLAAKDPVPRTYTSGSYWEWELNARGVRA